MNKIGNNKKLFNLFFQKLSVRIMFIMVIFLVLPLSILTIYVRKQMSFIIEEELSNQIIQNIEKNESHINESLQKLAYYSNRLIYDQGLRDRLSNPDSSQFYNSKYVDSLIESTQIDNADQIVMQARIAIFDNQKRLYTNWPLNYQDYSFLLNEKWVNDSAIEDGSIRWSFFQPSYMKNKGNGNDRFISLSREIRKDVTAGRRIGTLIISIDQQAISHMLTKYSMKDDDIFVCIEDGRILMGLENGQKIEQNEIEKIYSITEKLDSGELKRIINDKTYLVSFYTLPHPWTFDGHLMKVFQLTNFAPIAIKLNKINRQLDWVIIAVIIVVVVIAALAASLIVRPIQKLTKEMELFQVGATVKNIDEKRSDEIGQLNSSFIHMSDRVNELFDQLKRENRVKEQYHYESLRAQLNPHFLFNTLGTIRWMALIRGANNIVKAIDALAALLKYSLTRDTKLVDVRSEISNIVDYIYIHNLRYQDSIEVYTELSEELESLKILKFIFQPIVENAILHGRSEGQSEKITVRIGGTIENNQLIIRIEDNGVGISDDIISEFETKRQERVNKSKMTGIGLTNVDELIRIRFGATYGIKLSKAKEHGTVVTFILPVIKGEESDEENHDCGR